VQLRPFLPTSSYYTRFSHAFRVLK
jgi:hypothetical protein